MPRLDEGVRLAPNPDDGIQQLEGEIEQQGARVGTEVRPELDTDLVNEFGPLITRDQLPTLSTNRCDISSAAWHGCVVELTGFPNMPSELALSIPDPQSGENIEIPLCNGDFVRRSSIIHAEEIVAVTMQPPETQSDGTITVEVRSWIQDRYDEDGKGFPGFTRSRFMQDFRENGLPESVPEEVGPVMSQGVIRLHYSADGEFQSIQMGHNGVTQEVTAEELRAAALPETLALEMGRAIHSHSGARFDIDSVIATREGMSDEAVVEALEIILQNGVGDITAASDFEIKGVGVGYSLGAGVAPDQLEEKARTLFGDQAVDLANRCEKAMAGGGTNESNLIAAIREAAPTGRDLLGAAYEFMHLSQTPKEDTKIHSFREMVTDELNHFGSKGEYKTAISLLNE